uniref:Myosin VIIA and Rab interacting protein b n=1 Tax=Poecilia formosa TaxID=48698 RepID=A0A087XE36_POEFO
SEMKQELTEEGSRCSILSKQHRFNEHCCIRCCAPFTFLFNPKRQCLDCQYNVCKTCCTYSKRERAWLCSACQKGRLVLTQSLEWYYNNVKSRFKRFGSAKVLKTLYRKHIIERGAFSDLPESSVHDGSNDNDGSVCGSDSIFYRQSEGHSMAETLTVALRVAEEAIEEAIAKAEEFRDSLEKQNEARYLRDHKEELIEELATTIVQKIIQRRKRSEMQTEYDFVWPQPQSLVQTSELPSPSQPHTSSQDPLKNPYPLWRSRSAFSLTSDDSPEKGPEEEEEAAAAAAASGGGALQEYASLKREGKAASLPGWKSMDRLDNSSASSVLQSPDGNWIALHSSQLSRPSLLTKRKSLVFSVLEKESRVVSAYDEMGSDSEEEDEDDDGGWGAALQQFRRKLSDETYYTDSQHDPEWTYTQHPAVTSPSSGLYTNTETLNSDSEASSVLSACPRKPTHNLLRRKGPADSQSLSQHSAHTEALDVNFNPKQVTGDSSNADDKQCVRRSRRRRKSRKESSTDQNKPGGPNHAQSIYPLAQLDSVSPGPEIVSRSPGPGSGSGDSLEVEIRSKLSRLVSRGNSKDGVSSDEEDKQTEKESEKQKEQSKKEDNRQLISDVSKQKYSAASLCSITTEVLKVLNATEDLIGEAGGESYTPSESMSASPISSSSETRRLDQRLTKMEENVYLAAGAVYGLEGALGELEQCARSISSGTTDTDLAFLEDQVATAAAQVQQSELQISNIEARISALKTAGLNVTVCNRFSKIKPKSKPETLDSSRHQRRKLPAPPLKGIN